MLTRFNRLVGGLPVIALAAALTACGGGGGPTQTINDVPAVSVSASNVAAVKPYATALATVQPTLSIPSNLVANSGHTIPAGSTLKFTSTTDTSPTALAGFVLTSSAYTASGVLKAGSCIFHITQVSGNAPFSSGEDIDFDPCTFDLNTSSLVANGGPQNAPLAIRLGSTELTVNISVTPAANGTQVTITLPGGATITGTLNTGA